MSRIVVFASGSGSNLQAILDATDSGVLKANVVGLIASRPGIGALERVARAGIPSQILDPDGILTPGKEVERLGRWLDEWKPDVIALAGYLRKVPAGIIDRWQGRILNIHPSLLPKFGGKGFYGLRVHEAVLAAGEQTSGCTVHLVTQEYDEGAILAQAVLDVAPSTNARDLASRVLQLEHNLYPATIATHLERLKA